VRDGVQQGRCNEAVKPAQYWFERDEPSHTLASTSRDYLGAKRGSSGEKLALHDDMSLLKCWNVCSEEERCRGYGPIMGGISSFRVLWVLGSFARTSVESGKMPKSTTYRTRKIAVRFCAAQHWHDLTVVRKAKHDFFDTLDVPMHRIASHRSTILLLGAAQAKCPRT
jgi:hypothetical protein